jgi:predicted nucleic acid-binding protein
VDRLLIDTDVLIDFLRGRTESRDFLEGRTETILLSVVTLAELYAGVRPGAERIELDLLSHVVELVPVDGEIAMKAGLYRNAYRKSHQLGMADALIAATAESRLVPLVTLNRKHFPMLADVIVPYHKGS